MKYFIPLDVTITASDILESEGTDGTIYPFVVTDEYEKGVQRYYNTRLWESYTKIYPLATYSWNDLDPENKFTTRLSDNTIIDSTAVSVTPSTIVYVYTEETYYQSKQTRTVDFTTEVYDAANWDILTEPNNHYRYEWTYPQEGSIYWKDLGATNRHKCADQAVNSQSTKTATSMYFEFEAKSIDKVALFNISAQSSKITVYTVDINDPVYENTKEDLLDTTEIVDWRTLSLYEPSYVRSVDWTLPFFSGTVTIRITLESTASSLLGLGEILVGQGKDIGLTLDNVPIVIKSSGKIIEQDNGDIVFEGEGDVTKVYHVFNFTLVYDSMTLDATLDKCDTMINRRIVVTAEDSDAIQYRSLVVYGFSRDVSPTFISNAEKSNIKIQVQRFI